MATAKKLPSGAYRVRVYIGKDENGKPKYKSFTGPDKRKLERDATAYADVHRQATKITFFGDAATDYINSKRNILSPTTIEGYESIKRNYCDTELSAYPVENISDTMLQHFVNDLSVFLSPKTVRNAYGFITAVIYTQNFSRRFNVTLPKKQKQFKELPDVTDVIKAFKNTDIELAVMLALWLSLRMSEVRGLRYCDIKNNILTINNVLVYTSDGDILKSDAKTLSSKRRLIIPEYIQGLIPKDKSSNDFLVPYTVSQIEKRFRKILKEENLPPFRFHDLRHINASVMLSLGVPDKYAMERGGWSTPTVLKSIYQHTFSTERKLTDEKIDTYFNSLCHEI